MIPSGTTVTVTTVTTVLLLDLSDYCLIVIYIKIGESRGVGRKVLGESGVRIGVLIGIVVKDSRRRKEEKFGSLG